MGMSLRLALSLSTALSGFGPVMYANFAGGTAPSNLVYSRSSQATMTDASGNVVYGPNNLVRNSAATGATAGTPGTSPTNWNRTAFTGGTSGTLALTTINGGNGLELIVSGTPTASGNYFIFFETTSGIPATQGQRFGTQIDVQTVSATGVNNFFFQFNEYSSTPSFLTSGNSSTFPTNVGTLQTLSGVYTMANASAAYIRPALAISVTSGVPVSFDIKIGNPQVSQITAAQTLPLTYLPSNGAATYGPRFTYVNGAPAFLPEGATTNQIRNSTMQGAVVGDVELVSNTLSATAGTTSLTGWTSDAGGGSANWSWTGSAATVTGDGTHTSWLYAPLSVVSGQSYTLTFNGGTANGVNASVSTLQENGGTVYTQATYTGIGTYTVQFTATVTGTVYANFYKSGANSVSVSNVSVRRTYVTNGDFAANPINASQNTVQNGWQWSNSGTGTMATPSYSSGAVTIVGDGTNFQEIDTTITTVVGTTYTLTIDVAGAGAVIDVGTTRIGAQNGQFFTAVAAGQTYQFTATATTTWITVYRQGTTASTIDNVRVRSAGVGPTNHFLSAGISSVAWEVVGLNSESGVQGVDVRVWGTPASTNSFTYGPEQGSVIAAASGQTWTGSMAVRQLAGVSSGITAWVLTLAENTSGGSFVTGANYAVSAPTTSGLVSQRVSATRTLSGGATVANFQPSYKFTYTSGTAFDITLRFGMPQAEQQPAATSVVPTYGTALSRAAEVAYFTGASLGLGTAGTIIVEVAADDLNYGQIIGNDNGLTLLAHASSTTNQVYAQDSLGNSIIATLGSGTVSSPFRAGVAFDGTTISVAAAGGAVVSATGANPSLTKLYLGSRSDGFWMNRPISKVVVYNVKLSDVALTAKTITGAGF